MAYGSNREYVDYLSELYETSIKVTPRLYKVQGCIFGYHEVAPENTVGRPNEIAKADNRKELRVSNKKLMHRKDS